MSRQNRRKPQGKRGRGASATVDPGAEPARPLDRPPGRPIDLTLMAALPPPRPGEVPVSFTVSPAGEAVIAWASADDEARLRRRDVHRGGSFPRATLERPVTLRVTIDEPGGPRGAGGAIDPAARDVRELHGVRSAFPTVHRLPGEQLLVVGARAARRGGDPDHNATVFGFDGQPLHSACVGDGVQVVSTTAAGAIWVGYFDEGVLGNRGWGGAGAAPIGKSGWNRFDADLALTWSHHEGEIVDCYALTTTGEDCAICPYTDWPILRASPQRDGGCRVERWQNDGATGAHALLAVGTQVALVGGYGAERDRVVAGALVRGSFRAAPAIGRLTLDGQPWETAPYLIGRDGVLHAFDGERWYAVELWQMMELLDRLG